MKAMIVGTDDNDEEEEEEKCNDDKEKSFIEEERFIDADGNKKKKVKKVLIYSNSIRRSELADVYTTRVKKTYQFNYSKKQIKEDFSTLPYGY